MYELFVLLLYEYKGLEVVKMKKCVYPGSFDPITNGHLDVIIRASKIFDEVIVLIGNNITKKGLFSTEEKINMIKLVTKNYPNVKVCSFNGLIVDYCKENNINVIIRGIRNYTDYESEYDLYQHNTVINPNIETLLMMPKPENISISSSSIKEFLNFNCDISKYVPAELVDIIINKYRQVN